MLFHTAEDRRENLSLRLIVLLLIKTIILQITSEAFANIFAQRFVSDLELSVTGPWPHEEMVVCCRRHIDSQWGVLVYIVTQTCNKARLLFLLYGCGALVAKEIKCQVKH